MGFRPSGRVCCQASETGRAAWATAAEAGAEPPARGTPSTQRATTAPTTSRAPRGDRRRGTAHTVPVRCCPCPRSRCPPPLSRPACIRSLPNRSICASPALHPPTGRDPLGTTHGVVGPGLRACGGQSSLRYRRVGRRTEPDVAPLGRPVGTMAHPVRGRCPETGPMIPAAGTTHRVRADRTTPRRRPRARRRTRPGPGAGRRPSTRSAAAPASTARSCCVVDHPVDGRRHPDRLLVRQDQARSLAPSRGRPCWRRPRSAAGGTSTPAEGRRTLRGWRGSRTRRRRRSRRSAPRG